MTLRDSSACPQTKTFPWTRSARDHPGRSQGAVLVDSGRAIGRPTLDGRVPPGGRIVRRSFASVSVRPMPTALSEHGISGGCFAHAAAHLFAVPAVFRWTLERRLFRGTPEPPAYACRVNAVLISARRVFVYQKLLYADERNKHPLALYLNPIGPCFVEGHS